MGNELTTTNSPRYSMKNVEKQNKQWRKRVFKDACDMSIETLIDYIKRTVETIDRTQNIAVAITEKARLEILRNVLNQKLDR